MASSEDRLSTRDIASGSSGTETERDPGMADAPPADSGAVPADRVDRDDVDDSGRFETERDSDAVVTDEPVDGDTASARGPSRESVADDAAPAPGAAAAATSTTSDRDADSTDTTARDTTGTASTGAAGGSSADEEPPSELIPDSDGLQRRWEEIQVRFVDEPRGAVEDADALVATVMQRLAEGFAQEREQLEAQWGRGEDISTEDLRLALQRYRSFFRRLLST